MCVRSHFPKRFWRRVHRKNLLRNDARDEGVFRKNNPRRRRQGRWAATAKAAAEVVAEAVAEAAAAAEATATEANAAVRAAAAEAEATA